VVSVLISILSLSSWPSRGQPADAESHTRDSTHATVPRILPNHCCSLTLQHHGSIVDCLSHGQTRSKLPENTLIISGVICLLRLSGIVISFLAFFMGDGLAEEEETDLMDDGGAKEGTLALKGLLAWVILMIGAGAGAGAGVRGDEAVTVDGEVEARVDEAAWAGGVALLVLLDIGAKACAGFSCLIEGCEVGVVGVMEDEAALRKGRSVSGFTSLTADFLFLVGVLGTSKKDVWEMVLSFDGVADTARLATVGAATGATVGRADGIGGVEVAA
jgi:hypothetical protein